MVTKGVYLAPEDALAEAVAERLILDTGGALRVDVKLPGKGAGNLKKKLPELIGVAYSLPVLLITDLDRVACAPLLISTWKGSRKFPQDLLFRVAVREVESWLMADADALANWLNIKFTKIPSAPDTLADPKRTLLELAKKAPRAIREGLIKAPGAVASQGLGYNAVLGQFVRENWRAERAALRSPSLARARQRINELAAGCYPP